MARRAILVLGMHRSGTSAVAGVLVRLGAAAPRTLLPPAVDNPLGFWESAPFCEFNDRLLRAGGTEWDLWSRCIPESAPDTLTRFNDEFASLLRHEFGDAELFLVKDPRMCRLMPFWLRQLRTHDIDIGVVLVLRHPLEVAQSLALRDGITIEHALLQWLRHVLDSELTTREARRTVVDYEAVLTDWRGAVARIGADLGIEWRPLDADATAAIDAFVQPAMRHHSTADTAFEVTSPLATWLTDSWNALQQLRVQAGDPQALATLDRVRHEFDTLSPFFERIVWNERQRHRAQLAAMQARHTTELDGWREQAGAKEWRLRERTATAEWERDQLRDKLAFAEQEFQQLRGHADRVEKDASDSWSEVVRLREQVAALEEQTRLATGQLDAVQRQLAEARTQAESVSRRVHQAEQRVDALQHSLTWRLTAPLRAIVGIVLRLRVRPSHESRPSTARSSR